MATPTYEQQLAMSSVSSVPMVGLDTTPTPPSTGGAQPKPAVTPPPTTSKTVTPAPQTFNLNSLQSIAAQVEAIRQQALKIQENAKKLSEKQSTTTANVVSSSAPTVQNEKNVTNEVNNAVANNVSTDSAKSASDQYIATLDDQIAKLEERRKSEVAAIEADYARQADRLDQAQYKERGTTNVALQRVGGYLGVSASGTGVLQNLAVTHRDEVTALEGRKQAAIAAAKAAIDDKQFALAQAKSKEIKDIEKEINDRRNKFFDQSMKIVEENRQKEQEDRLQKKQKFDQALSTIDRVAPTVAEALKSFTSENDAVKYLTDAAKEYQVDPNLLLGEVNKIYSERRQKEVQQVVDLAQKYVDAGITNEDTIESATEKIRTKSKTYALDTLKAETDIANAQSLINSRGGTNGGVDYSSPILGLYTKVTGSIVSSPSQARAIEGYADALLGDKEIVDDKDVTEKTPLLENQIKASDAQKLLQDSFSQLNKAKDNEVPDATVWTWLSTPAAQGMSDEEKSRYIMQVGKNPEDFGYFN